MKKIQISAGNAASTAPFNGQTNNGLTQFYPKTFFIASLIFVQTVASSLKCITLKQLKTPSETFTTKIHSLFTHLFRPSSR